MNRLTKPRVLIALEHPVQHFSDSFRLATDSMEMDVSVLYWADDEGGRDDPDFGMHISWDIDLRSGYPWRKVEGSRFDLRVANFHRVMKDLSPDVVICFGWGSAVARLTIAWCALTRTPMAFYGDTTWQFASGTAGHIRSAARPLVLKSLFRMAAGAVSTGTFNREFYIFNGMHPDQVVDGVWPIDVSGFSRARESRDRQSDFAPCVIGFAGKMIPRKGVDDLLQALGSLSADTRWRARIVGEGIERPRLEKLAGSLGIADRVDFVGFRNTSQMPAELASCDIVVMPSRRENRGVVAVEAMAAGAAVIVSSNTGVWGRGDVLEDGVTGWVYRSGDPAHLAEVLTKCITDPDLRTTIQGAGSNRALGQGPEAFVAGVERAVAAFSRG